MKPLLCQILVIALILLSDVTHCPAASPAATVLKAKQEAEARGYGFIAGHDEIVTRAKSEGRLRVLGGMERSTAKAAAAAFGKKYPFINLQIGEIEGADQAERNILEIKSGARNWDIHRIANDRFADYLPYLLKVDILGMAERGILQIPPPMVDPKNRNVLAFYSRFQVIAYHKDLLPPSQVPKVWEDLLRPELKDRKFMLDTRAADISFLVSAWGLEKTVDFARKLAAQQPVWVQGGSRGLASVISGEIPMIVGPYFNGIKRAQVKDPSGVLKYMILEPVPVRQSEIEGIQASAQNPHAALLWFEWMASLEAQKLADEYEPFASSIHVSGGAIQHELKGRTLAAVSWEQQEQVQEWQRKILQAYGFPKAEIK